MAVAAGGRRGVAEAEVARAAAAPALPKLQSGLLSTLTARRLAALIVLLEGLHELRDPRHAGDGDSYRSPGLLLRSHEPGCLLYRTGTVCSCVQSAVSELERLLALMRSDEPQMRFHLVAWFVDADRRGRWERRPRPRRRRPWSPQVYRRWVERNPRADRRQALAGVRWLAERWALRDVRGELVEPWLLAPGLDSRAFERLASLHSGLVRPETG